MSHTPRIDAALSNTQGMFRAAAASNGFADFARELERENAKLREENTRLQRGEFVCCSCGLRKDSDAPQHPDF